MNIPSVWIADDDTDDCFFYEEALHEIKAECNIRNFSNSQSLVLALEESNGQLPSLLILDARLPGKSALDVLRIIHDHPSWSLINVTIVSGCLLPGEKMIANNLGVQIFEKPFLCAQITGLIKSLLSTLPGIKIVTAA